MKDRVNKRTRMNLEAEDRRLAHIKQHVAKLKAEHEGRNDFDFGTKGTVNYGAAFKLCLLFHHFLFGNFLWEKYRLEYCGLLGCQ